jgi:hypothetical protein
MLSANANHRQDDELINSSKSALRAAGGINDTVFSVCAEKTTLISPAPQRELPVTQATRGIACPKPSEEPQVSTFVAGGSLCALRRCLLAGQVFLKPKT